MVLISKSHWRKTRNGKTGAPPQGFYQRQSQLHRHISCTGGNLAGLCLLELLCQQQLVQRQIMSQMSLVIPSAKQRCPCDLGDVHTRHSQRFSNVGGFDGCALSCLIACCLSLSNVSELRVSSYVKLLIVILPVTTSFWWDWLIGRQTMTNPYIIHYHHYRPRFHSILGGWKCINPRPGQLPGTCS